MTLPEDISCVKLHHGLGMSIRNSWGLWGKSDLKQFLIDSGFTHPDDMSAMIFMGYHRYLNGKPVNLKYEAQQFAKYWNKDSTVQIERNSTDPYELLKYFPVGDTILTHISAVEKKLFSKYASYVQTIGVVKEHEGEKMKVLLIKVCARKNHIPENKAGELIETYPINATLIPSKKWKKK